MTVGRPGQVLWMAGLAWLVVLAGSALAGSVLGGCGGQVDAEDDSMVSEEPEASDGSDGTATSGSGGAAELGPGDLALGECELGFLRAGDERPCNWLAEDRCYETKAKACACVCPVDGPSVCVSGFYEGEDSETRVSCR